jgi:hypothetical protein
MKVSLIGDSIREQYQDRVKELLGEDFEVYSPKENCRFSKYIYRGLFEWAKGMTDSRIVHWNTGHWDICDLFGFGPFTPEGEFIENINRIADILESRHEIIIFATTTPVTDNNRYNSNDVIKRYNEIAVSILEKRGVIINDMNTPLYPERDRYISSDTIHLSPEGIELCALMVANKIKEAAKRLDGAAKQSNTESGQDDVGAPVLI